jgi:hypothetical protein
MAGAAIDEAKAKLLGVMESFGKNYLSSMVANALKPVITDALMSMMDDTKKEVGMKPEDKENGDKGNEQKDLFGMQLDSCRKVATSWGFEFTSYTLYAIRVGYNKGGNFYALGAKYEVRYNVIRVMWDKVAKENEKDKKEKDAPLPPDCLHGTYCCCLERKSDMSGTEAAMKGYLVAFAAAHRSSSALASHFYLGDNYEAQQRSKVVFDEAFSQTQAALIKGEYIRDLPPYDEGEALKALLLAVSRQDIVPVLRPLMQLPGGVGAGFAERSLNTTIVGMVDVAMAGWPVAQAVVDKAKVKVQEMIDSGAQKLVDALKPVLKKVFELVQSKLAKKDEGKEEKLEEKKKKTEIGDYLNQWRFDKTEIGKKLYEALGGGANAYDALLALQGDFDNAVTSSVEAKMKDGVANIIGEKAASMELVSLILEAVAKQALGVIKRFTTIKPLMSASHGVFLAYNTFIQMLKASYGAASFKPDAHVETVAPLIETCSQDMWKSFPDAGLLLFSKMDALKAHIKSEFPDVCDEALEPLTSCADELYSQQMIALNSMRVEFIKTIKAKLTGDALKSFDSAHEIVRTAFRDLVFAQIHSLALDGWKKVSCNLIKSAIIQVQKKFEETVWPTIASALEAIQSMIPEQLASIGLKIEPMARAVANIILEKGTNWALNKLIIKLELVLFEQAGTVLNM